MRHVETWTGAGKVISNTGQQTPVQYEIHTYQKEVPAGTLGDPHATIHGMLVIQGRIQPVCFSGEDELVLEMQDGRKMKFSFTGRRGSIAFREWINPRKEGSS